MRKLTPEETELTSGSGPMDYLVTGFVTAIGIGYAIGHDLAEQDNGVTCKK